MAKQKKRIVREVTREQADAAFAVYVKSEAEIEKIQAEIELQCARIREKRADRLSVLGIEREEAFSVLQGYAMGHPDLFAKKKSLEMAHGVIGFRTGTPKLKTLKGFTWASALELVRCFLPSGYVRTTEEIAKDRLLADRDLSEVEVLCDRDGVSSRVSMRDAMARCGIQVVQDESFYAEGKKEESYV